MADEFTYLIAVGSNLGDRYEHIRQALDSLTRRSVFIQKQAALIETKPMGAADQPFVNGAFVAKSAHDPAAMMTLLLDVETELGRTRHIKWGNRTIDLDILLVRDSLGRAIEMTSDHLTVPHPRMWERDFVMIPAREVWNFKDSERLLGQYFSTEKSVFSWLILGAVTRWFLAWMVPFGNDEAYYWDWSRDLQISYFDHPPMVAWIGWLGTHLAPWADPTLSGRLIVPVMHFVACLGILKILKLLTMQPSLSPRENFNFVLITQLVPAFSLGGMMLMPDVGLILFSTLAIHATMKASRGKDLGIRQGFFVGLFWGLAGLSKYHAALLAVGGLGALAWQRRNDWLKDLWFWMTVVAVGLLVVSPVFVWNAQHQWASFAYQGSRGLSGDGFRVLPAFRTLVGELLFFGPLLLGGIWFFQKSAKSTSDSNRETNRAAVWFILFAALPLLFILKIFSFTSQTLPRKDHAPRNSLWHFVLWDSASNLGF
ncbi:MAG: 2-amino-4-hydroxy-6-hydroxymethyldihydropteridine diphosphokinase [Proteobacteria bacterium]|nr:2-amino-4-hydroxy-6-hydroxymethyldihydropteridine diphosphokinase [Pseudomonadota bacterium]